MSQNTIAFSLTHRMVWLLTLMVVQNLYLFGQNRTLQKPSEQWLQSYHRFDLGGGWQLLADGGLRWKNGFDEFSQFVIRSSLGYTLNQRLRISAGYSFLGRFGQGERTHSESRPFQDLSLNLPMGKIFCKQRIRIEERRVNKYLLGNRTGETDFRMRYRYAIHFLIPIYQFSSNAGQKKLFINIGDEVFLQTGQKVFDHFDQNRVIVGPVFRYDARLSMKLLYQYQYASSDPYQSYTQKNIVWLTLNHNMNLFDPKKHG